MTPQIREHIHTVVVSVASMGEMVAGGKISAYFTEAFFTTNIRENTFHGMFRCNVPFKIVRPVEIPTEAAWIAGSHPEPKALNDREYELRLEMSNTVWDAEHPAYLGMVSEQPVGSCSFERLE